MPSFRDLKAWQHGKALGIDCARAARVFPGGERNPLARQLMRAAFSVPLNIAEGSARKGPREFRRFLDTARGSLAEVQTALEMTRELEYLPREECQRLEALAAETARTLWGLLSSVGRRLAS